MKTEKINEVSSTEIESEELETGTYDFKKCYKSRPTLRFILCFIGSIYSFYYIISIIMVSFGMLFFSESLLLPELFLYPIIPALFLFLFTLPTVNDDGNNNFEEAFSPRYYLFTGDKRLVKFSENNDEIISEIDLEEDLNIEYHKDRVKVISGDSQISIPFGNPEQILEFQNDIQTLL